MPKNKLIAIIAAVALAAITAGIIVGVSLSGDDTPTAEDEQAYLDRVYGIFDVDPTPERDTALLKQGYAVCHLWEAGATREMQYASQDDLFSVIEINQQLDAATDLLCPKYSDRLP